MESYESMKRSQLQSLCKQHSIKASGKNAELVERLLAFDAAQVSVSVVQEPAQEKETVAPAAEPTTTTRINMYIFRCCKVAKSNN